MAAKKVTAEEKTTKVNDTATTVETVVKKAARRKPGRKPASKAAAAPKAETKPEVKAETKPAPAETMVLQFGGREIDGSELFARAKEIWTETGHDAAKLSDVKLYVKPDELAAYYVLNGDVTGCINL